MSRHFASTDEPWFRIGRLDVSTVTLVGLIGVASGLAWVFEPMLPALLFFNPSLVAAGQLWRVLTWPLANTIWVLITALMLWYFGGELERLMGRVRMLWLIAGTWAALTVASTVVSLLPALSGSMLFGLDLIEFAVLLLWIAEYPNRPLFFGIPAWIIGVVFVAIQALSLLAARNLGALLSLVLGMVFVAMLARRFGLLGAYEWIPGKPATARPPRTRTPRASRATRASARQDERRQSDREQLDALLDQINDHGIQSLTDAQRKELLRLRDRLRRN